MTRARVRWRGVAAGVLLASALPIAYLICAFLVGRGILDLEQMEGFRAVINSLTLNASVAFLLILLGIRVMGNALGLRSAVAWLVFVVFAIPVFGFMWFVSYASLGGAMGSPF